MAKIFDLTLVNEPKGKNINKRMDTLTLQTFFNNFMKYSYDVKKFNLEIWKSVCGGVFL